METAGNGGGTTQYKKINDRIRPGLITGRCKTMKIQRHRTQRGMNVAVKWHHLDNTGSPIADSYSSSAWGMALQFR